MQRVDITTLSLAQRQAALVLITAMLGRVSLTKVEEICAALGRQELLIEYNAGRPVGCAIAADTRLTRADLVEAANLELRLRATLGEEAATETLAFLAGPNAVLGLLAGAAAARLHRTAPGGGNPLHTD